MQGEEAPVGQEAPDLTTEAGEPKSIALSGGCVMAWARVAAPWPRASRLRHQNHWPATVLLGALATFPSLGSTSEPGFCSHFLAGRRHGGKPHTLRLSGKQLAHERRQLFGAERLREDRARKIQRSKIHIVA